MAIADAIGDAVHQGQLRPGDALPTHRLLADLVGVNVSTITRAYHEAARRRLVGGEVGRGTFVLGVASETALFALEHRPDGGVIDLSLNVPPRAARDQDLAAALKRMDPTQAAGFLHYPSPDEVLVHRQAAVGWLKRRGVEADPEGLVVCAGAQHAMVTALHFFQEEEEVVCESLVYPGLRASARHWQRRLHPVPMDAEGILPDAFETACRGDLRFAVVSPTLHNPTTATMSLQRRRRIVEIARKWNVMLVEEDVYGMLQENAPPPLYTLAPERVLYLTGLSKTVAPGLRIGYLVLPPGLRGRMHDDEHHTTWYVSSLTMAIATRWLNDGTAWRRLVKQRAELAARYRMCQEQLKDFTWRGEPHCPHVWLVAPPGGSEAFAKRALAAGVVVVPSSVLAAGRLFAADGVRISLGAPPDRKTLAEGLSRLASLARHA
ncbi:MAG: PLP-dependent aminotransferase family protein [Holophaga sp.]|nr:PLP-dependent aminotransferase family protein [Holophaga sp.]